jgi:hypothetical protein
VEHCPPVGAAGTKTIVSQTPRIDTITSQINFINCYYFYFEARHVESIAQKSNMHKTLMANFEKSYSLNQNIDEILKYMPMLKNLNVRMCAEFKRS